MRSQDRVEYEALTGSQDYETGLLRSINDSTRAVVLTVAGEPAVLFGVAPYTYLGDVGVPWMVSTDYAVRHRHALMRLAPLYIRRMLALYPRLYNVVHERNTISRRWLGRMGFSFGAVVLIRGEPFIKFYKG
jgi:hypothetical protein